jgi:Xaa-Pro dipeptidase
MERGTTMALHFDREEFDSRRRRVLEAMAAQGFDALLIFKQESMYWLCGYDSFGYCFFQCLVLRADGDLVLTTRAPDLRQAQHTSILDAIRVWVDREGSDPTEELRGLLAEKGLAGKRLGVEYASHGLTAATGRRLDAGLDGFVALDDASAQINRLRLVKSDAELAYVRRAAQLADDALEAAIAETGPGADEGDILAAMQGAVFRGGGDYPGNAFIIGSGRDALLCRYRSRRRRLDPKDQLTLEFAGVDRHYHACLMRTLLVGEATARHRALYAACREALAAAEAKLMPRMAMGAVFDAQAEILDRHGMRAHRLNACGYSLGAVYPPSWMDWPMFFHGNPEALAPGMVFFLHMILMDSEAGAAMTLGRTSLITDRGSEPLSAATLDLVVR